MLDDEFVAKVAEADRRGRRDLRAHGQLPGRPHPLLRRLLRRRPPRRASARSSSSRRASTRAPTGWTGRPAPRCTRSTSPRCSSTRRPRWTEHGVDAVGRAPRGADRPALRLAERVARSRFRRQRADRVAGRGAADVPARRRPGPALRAGHRAVRARAAASRPRRWACIRRSAASRCGSGSSASPRSSAWTTPSTSRELMYDDPDRADVARVARRARLAVDGRHVAGRDAPAGPGRRAGGHRRRRVLDVRHRREALSPARERPLLHAFHGVSRTNTVARGWAALWRPNRLVRIGYSSGQEGHPP